MGSLFKPSQQKTTSTSTPWGPQGDALQHGFDSLGGALDQQLNTPYYQGDMYAGMDPLTSQGVNANAGYATGAGAQAAGAVGSTSQGLLPSGASGMGAYDKLLSMGSTDPTQGNITSAGQYADNPYMSGMIDAASRDVTRNLFENQLPGLNQAATGSGNINSSRAGVAQGIMERGAADQIGDIASQMRGNAYSQGLSLAEQGRQANMGAVGAAGQGYGDIYDLGLKGSALGQDMTFNNNNALITGGQLNQQDAQGQMNADYQQWLGNDQRDMSALGNYFNMVNGVPSFGTTTGSTPGASPFQNIAGAATSALGAYMMFSDKRLKTDVKQVGIAPNGLTVHSWRYRQDRGLDLPLGTHTGFMADEVAEKYPEAVSVEHGYLKVDYGKLR